jgi:hypothetical protein
MKNPDFKPLHATKMQQRFEIMKPPSFIQPAIMQDSVSDNSQNDFAIFLTRRFGKEKADELLKMYNVGTLNGSTVFWQVDVNGNVRSGKMMFYNDDTGKRRKRETNIGNITWVHKVLDIPDFNLVQCFFGEHLLPLYPDKKVIIVESEKTAIIASLYVPEYLWLANSGNNGLSAKKFEVLKNRDVILHPDHGQYEKWLEKSKTLKHVGSLHVTDVIVRISEEDCTFEDGFDIADVLLKRYKHTK